MKLIHGQEVMSIHVFHLKTFLNRLLPKFGIESLDRKLPDKFIVVFIKFHKNSPLLPNMTFQIQGTIILPAVYTGMELGLSH